MQRRRPKDSLSLSLLVTVSRSRRQTLFLSNHFPGVQHARLRLLPTHGPRWQARSCPIPDTRQEKQSQTEPAVSEDRDGLGGTNPEDARFGADSHGSSGGRGRLSDLGFALRQGRPQGGLGCRTWKPPGHHGPRTWECHEEATRGFQGTCLASSTCSIDECAVV